MIGLVLGWKFNNTPGIVTRNGAIVEWPAALGPVPSQGELDTWTAEYLAAQPDIEAAQTVDSSDKLIRLLFEINYDQESRLRVLEGRPAITRTQYRTALIASYKAL